MLIFPPPANPFDRRQNDRAFMERLYIEHRYLLFKVAMGIVKDAQAAEDVVSEGCMSLISHIDALRKLNICKLRAYIVTTIRNASYDYVHRRMRQSGKSFLTGDVSDHQVPDEHQIDDDVIRRAEIASIRHALKQLPDAERALLRMKYFDLMTDAEIAQHTDIQISSVRYVLTKARRN